MGNMSAISNKDLQLNLEKTNLDTELRKVETALEQKNSEFVVENEKRICYESEVKHLEDKLEDMRTELEKNIALTADVEAQNKNLVIKVDKLESASLGLKVEIVSKTHEVDLMNKDVY